MMATRWGILSTGKIAQDFTSALVSQSPQEHKVVAVAARSGEKAKEFAAKYDIPAAYGSYEELAQDPNVDVIYIGSIHPEHHKLSMMCLKAGKHVLCEKPMTLTLAGAREVHQTAKEKNRFFLEGYWSRFFPVCEKLRQELSSNSIGDIINVNLTFCIDIFGVPRLNDIKLGGGALMDIGCYGIMMFDLIFNERPEKIIAEGQIENGVDSGGAITMRFSGGRIANMVYTAKSQSLTNNLIICGTKGSIKIDDPFWCSTRITSPSGPFHCPLPACKFPMNFHQSEGFQYEQQCVRECLKKGELQCPLMTHSSSENILYMLEQALTQMGVRYDFQLPV